MSKVDYRAYLRSDKWRHIRSEILQRSGGYCEVCSRRRSGIMIKHRAVEVHHLTYVRLGDELPVDLLAVCARCHDRLHNRTNANHKKVGFKWAI